jgi:hypothetical protein
MENLTYEQILKLPVNREPPSGKTPRFDDPPRQDTLAIIIVVLSTVFSVLAVVLRFYAKVFCVRRVLVEDYLGFAGFIIYMSMVAMMCLLIKDEVLFVHDWNLLFEGFKRFRELNVAFTSSQAIMVILLKSAILWEWIRIFVPGRIRNWFYWIGIMTIAMNMGIYLSGLFIANFSCTPREKIFKPWLDGHCMRVLPEVFILIGVLNLFGHIMIILLPQPIIWRLQLNVKRRLGISFIFSLGILTCAAACGRVILLTQMDFETDAAYDLSEHVIWTMVEMTCLILVFCVPTIPRIFSSSATPLPLLRRKKKTLPSITDQNASGTWPLSTLRSRPGRPYQQMTEQERDASQNRELSDEHNHNGILKVVEIITEEEPVDETGATQYDQYHTWVG